MARKTSRKRRKPLIKKEDCRVHSVYDGDTITVERVKSSWMGLRKQVRHVKVRLAYIDTPELRYQETGARTAKELLDDLIDGKEITLEYAIMPNGTPRTCSFNRILAVVHLQRLLLPTININELLLRRGVARLYHDPDNITPHYRKRFARAERYARRRHLGIWRTADLKPGFRLPPWFPFGVGLLVGIAIGLMLM